MLKKLIFLLFLSFSALSLAESLGYQTLSPAQPTQNQDKIEIIEFFSYGCIHCYSLEPTIDKWLETKPDNVEFIRQPVIFNRPLWRKYARAYFIAEALGVVDKIHADFFYAIHNKKIKLGTEDQLAEFFVDHGVDETDFRNTYNSFLVDAKLRQAKSMAPRYGILGTPAIIINGKYKTNGRIAKSHENMIEAINHLIQQESQAK